MGKDGITRADALATSRYWLGRNEGERLLAAMRAFLTASLVLWASRAAFRRRKWHGYVASKEEGDPLRKKWFRLYEEAVEMVRDRRKQISRLPVTHLDVDGIALLRREEGVRHAPYNDSRGNCTVGVGHLIHKGPCTTKETRRRLTDSEVNALLRDDIARFERVVRKAFSGKRALKATQNRFNAAVSLAFNIGPAGFSGSTVARRIGAGDLDGAASAFLMWDNPFELRPRREREKRLFLS